MPTTKTRIQIPLWQYDIIKDSLVESQVLDLLDASPGFEDPDQCEKALLSLISGKPCELIQAIQNNTAAAMAITQLTAIWENPDYLKTAFIYKKGEEDNLPSLARIRVAVLQAIIETLHGQFPQRKNAQPILEPVPELEGMQRIRALFKQYITKTTPGSLERYKLALEILLEKENLNISSDLLSETDVTQTAGFAPGDFSHLDLSYLDLQRDDGQDGNFQGLILHHSNCDGSNWRGLSLLDTDFTDCSLRGANLSELSNDTGINLSRTDIEGSYFGENYIVDRRAKNYTEISRTTEQLAVFQLQLQQKIHAEKLQAAEIKNFNSFKEAYFNDYHSRFFKNPFSTMKSMLDHDRIQNTTEVRNYVEEHPTSRTATVYSSIPLVTVDDLVEIEPSSPACQTS